MSKDTCYLTDEETKIRNEITEEKHKTYIEGFGYVAPSKTKTIIVASDGDINKMVGTMEQDIGIKSNLSADITAIKARYGAKAMQVGYLPHLHIFYANNPMPQAQSKREI